MHLEKTKGFSTPSPPTRPKRNRNCRLPKAVQSIAHVSQPNKDQLHCRILFDGSKSSFQTTGIFDIHQLDFSFNKHYSAQERPIHILYTSRSSILHHVTCQLNRCASDMVFSVESEKRRTGKNSKPLPPPSCIKNCKCHYMSNSLPRPSQEALHTGCSNRRVNHPGELQIADYHLRIMKPLKHSTKQLVAPPPISLSWVELGTDDITNTRDECKQF